MRFAKKQMFSSSASRADFRADFGVCELCVLWVWVRFGKIFTVKMASVKPHTHTQSKCHTYILARMPG
jgi:hypothetical protein